jgi:hypothetical protein
MSPSGCENRLFDRDLTGRVRQRRALLVSPGGTVKTALNRRQEPLLLAAAGGLGAQIVQLGPRPPRIGLALARRTAPVALPEPGRHAAGRDADHRHRDDHHKQRQLHRNHGRRGIERIERYRDQMTVGDREDDEEQPQRNDDQRVEEFSHDHLSS